MFQRADIAMVCFILAVALLGGIGAGAARACVDGNCVDGCRSGNTTIVQDASTYKYYAIYFAYDGCALGATQNSNLVGNPVATKYTLYSNGMTAPNCTGDGYPQLGGGMGGTSQQFDTNAYTGCSAPPNS